MEIEYTLDPETITVLRDYRTHTTRVIAEYEATRKVYRRKNPHARLHGNAPGETWTETLSMDWMQAGPVYSCFPRDRWPLLQRLRNQHGPAILDQLDALIDAS